MEELELEKLGIRFYYYIKKRATGSLDLLWAEINGYFDPKTDAWIDQLYIPPQQRNENHYGTKLLEQFENECKREKVRRICACFWPDNDEGDIATLKFYKNKGYTFEQIDEDTIILYKDLI